MTSVGWPPLGICLQHSEIWSGQALVWLQLNQTVVVRALFEPSPNAVQATCGGSRPWQQQPGEGGVSIWWTGNCRTHGSFLG